MVLKPLWAVFEKIIRAIKPATSPAGRPSAVLELRCPAELALEFNAEIVCGGFLSHGAKSCQSPLESLRCLKSHDLSYVLESTSLTLALYASWPGSRCCSFSLNKMVLSATPWPECCMAL